jgi:predicted RNase H-like HicB family nuclease
MNNITEVIFLVEESSEGGYEARALGESIFTEGEDLAELKKNVKEAVITHYEDGKHPAVIRLHFVREELIKV